MQVPYANTTNFSVSYDTTFTGGSYPNGPALAQGVVDYCDYDFARLSLLFGGILPRSLPIQIQLVPAQEVPTTAQTPSGATSTPAPIPWVCLHW